MKKLLTAALFGAMATGAQAADDVTLQLKWVTQAQFAGYYVAAAKGFYEEEGLNVTILPGGPDVAPTQVIAGGGADVVVGCGRITGSPDRPQPPIRARRTRPLLIRGAALVSGPVRSPLRARDRGAGHGTATAERRASAAHELSGLSGACESLSRPVTARDRDRRGYLRARVCAHPARSRDRGDGARQEPRGWWTLEHAPRRPVAVRPWCAVLPTG